jgi:hypothetical protein
MDNPVCVCAYAFGLSEREKKRHMYRLRALTQQEKRERESSSFSVVMMITKTPPLRKRLIHLVDGRTGLLALVYLLVVSFYERASG